jgi:ribonuclease BN (tRNA processing enzyme)
MDARLIRRLALCTALALAPAAARAGCEGPGVQLQVLGSGGEELAARRAGSSYLLWIDGKPRALIDIGGGATLRFGESGANTADLDVILFTSLQADRTSGLPSLVASSLAEKRDRPLPVYGPPGNRFALSTVAFVREQFDATRGVYRYLGRVLSPLARDTYRLEPHDVRPRTPKLPETLQGKQNDDPLLPAFRNERLNATAAIVDLRDVPVLAWRLEAGGKQIVIAPDLRGQRESLLRLAKGADLLVLPLTVSPAGSEPLVLAGLARQSGARQLLLSRRTPTSLGREDDIGARLREHYPGAITFANDLMCVSP